MTHPPRIYITPEHVDGTDYWDNGSWTTTEGTGVPYEPSPQWQDISTAPKDGRCILLAKMSCDEWSGMFVAYWREDIDEWSYSAENVVRNPTHWRPLPPAPESTK